MRYVINLAAVILALAATFTISACVGLSEPYWTSAEAFRPTTITVRYTNDLSQCDGGRANVLGCATRIEHGKFRDCWVLIRAGMPEWRTTCVLKHEVLAHCIEGREHADVATNECGV